MGKKQRVGALLVPAQAVPNRPSVGYAAPSGTSCAGAESFVLRWTIANRQHAVAVPQQSLQPVDSARLLTLERKRAKEHPYYVFCGDGEAL